MSLQNQVPRKVPSIKEKIEELRHDRENYIVSSFRMAVEHWVDDRHKIRNLAYRIWVDRRDYTGEAVMWISNPIEVVAVLGEHLDDEREYTYKIEDSDAVLSFASALLFDGLEPSPYREFNCKRYWYVGGNFEAVRCSDGITIRYLLFYIGTVIAVLRVRALGKKVKVMAIRDRAVRALETLFGVGIP